MYSGTNAKRYQGQTVLHLPCRPSWLGNCLLDHVSCVGFWRCLGLYGARDFALVRTMKMVLQSAKLLGYRAMYLSRSDVFVFFLDHSYPPEHNHFHAYFPAGSMNGRVCLLDHSRPDRNADRAVSNRQQDPSTVVFPGCRLIRRTLGNWYIPS